jgi:hypothetical protein
MQLLVAADFAVSNVEKIGPSGDSAEGGPRLNVRRIISSVARICFIMNGHRTIRGNGQAIHQLFQVGPMVLAVTPCEKKARSGDTGYATVGFDGS